VSNVDNNNFFSTHHLKDDLKGQSLKGGALTVFSNAARFVLQMTSTVVLARILFPEDFGLVAMVTAISGFAGLFTDLGLSMATIQKKELNHEQVSTLFCINACLGVFLMLLVASLSQAIAWFYSEERLVTITLALSTSFLFGGLTVQHKALLERMMQFGRLATLEIVSMALAVAIGLTLAIIGAGYWSLVWMIVFRSASKAFGTLLLCGWRPGLPVRGAGVRSMLRFGTDVIAFRTLNYFARRLDRILIGRFCGVAALGLYDRAYRILMFPIEQIRTPLTAVAMPAMSALQNDHQQYRKYFNKLISLTAFLSMPLVSYLFVYNKEFILLILGKKWLGVSPIFQALALAAFIQTVSHVRGIVLLSTGNTKRLVKFGVFNSTIIVLSFVIGLKWGAVGVALAYSIANYVILIPSLWYCFRFSPITIGLFFQSISYPALSSIAMGVLLYITRNTLLVLPNIATIVISFLTAVAIYLTFWAALPQGRQMLRQYQTYAMMLIQKKSAL